MFNLFFDDSGFFLGYKIFLVINYLIFVSSLHYSLRLLHKKIKQRRYVLISDKYLIFKN